MWRTWRYYTIYNITTEYTCMYSLAKRVYYTKKWKLNINLKKSKVLIFGTPTQKRWHSASIWTFGKNILEQVDEYCYLGITLHFSGTFKRAQKIIYGIMEKHYMSIIVGYI